MAAAEAEEEEEEGVGAEAATDAKELRALGMEVVLATKKLEGTRRGICVVEVTRRCL